MCTLPILSIIISFSSFPVFSFVFIILSPFSASSEILRFLTLLIHTLSTRAFFSIFFLSFSILLSFLFFKFGMPLFVCSNDSNLNKLLKERFKRVEEEEEEE